MSNHSYAKDFYLLGSENILKKLEDLEEANDCLRMRISAREEVCDKYKKIIDEAIKVLEEGITFCENDGQGIYDKCNIAIHREKSVLKILKGVSKWKY